MITWIAADMNFYNKELIKQLGTSEEKYAEILIQNWNSVISEADYVLILGNFSFGTLEQTKQILSLLKGHKRIIDFNREKSPFSREDWIQIGIEAVWCTSGFIQGEINNELTAVYIAVDKNTFELFKKNKMYYAAAQSLSGCREIYCNNILNLSVNYWGYTPIEYERLPFLIDNQIMFEQMENNEKKIN